MITGSLAEIFASTQGEGPFLGVKQIFLRFAVCNLRCQWCDTPEALFPVPVCCVWHQDDTRTFRQNPMTVDDVLGEIDGFLASGDRPHSVSLTGGEPLIQPAMIRAVAMGIHQRRLLTYLETAGTLDKALESVIDEIDIVSMDLKLPSSTGEGNHWDAHGRFLRIANRKTALVKMVVTRTTTDEDVMRGIQLVSDYDRSIPVVLQPVTRLSLHTCAPPKPDQMERWRDWAHTQVSSLLVLPQVHHLVGMK